MVGVEDGGGERAEEAIDIVSITKEENGGGEGRGAAAGGVVVHSNDLQCQPRNDECLSSNDQSPINKESSSDPSIDELIHY